MRHTSLTSAQIFAGSALISMLCSRSGANVVIVSSDLCDPTDRIVCGR
jgi:hypothetical protein